MAARPYCPPGPRHYDPRAPNLVWNNVHGPPPPPNQQNWNRPNYGGPRGGYPPFQQGGPRWQPPANNGAPFQQNSSTYYGNPTADRGNFYGYRGPSQNDFGNPTPDRGNFHGNRGPSQNDFRQNGPNRRNKHNFQSHNMDKSSYMENNWQVSGQPVGSGYMNGGHGGFTPSFRGNVREFKKGRDRGSGKHPFRRGIKKKKEPKPEKPSKRDLAENNVFFCDTCDRGFPVEERFQEHNDQHQKCSFDGCPYIAAPRLVKQHILLQHASGLAKKVWSLESQEDINKWREERKKNFPTTETIEKKKALLEERKSRGEVLQNKYFGKMKGKDYNKQHIALNQNQKGTRKRNQSALGNGGQGAKKQKASPGNQTWDDNGETESKTHPIDKAFMTPEIKKAIKARNRARTKAKKADTEELWGAYRIIRCKVNKMITEKKEEMGIETCRAKRKRIREAANQSADGVEQEGGDKTGESNMEKSAVEGDCDDETEAPEEKSVLKDQTSDLDPDDVEGTSNNEESINNEMVDGHTDDVMDKRRNPRVRNRRGKKQESKSNASAKTKRTSSLLEKLLANDIRHERNVILQCVHYVVKNNFFGVGQSCDQKQSNEMNDHSSCDSPMANDQEGQGSCDSSVNNDKCRQQSSDLSSSNTISGHSIESCDTVPTNRNEGHSPSDQLLSSDNNDCETIGQSSVERSVSTCDTEKSNDNRVTENTTDNSVPCDNMINDDSKL